MNIRERVLLVRRKRRLEVRMRGLGHLPPPHYNANRPSRGAAFLAYIHQAQDIAGEPHSKFFTPTFLDWVYPWRDGPSEAVDISDYQGWIALPFFLKLRHREDVRSVMIKASGETNFQSKHYRRLRLQARLAGLQVGAYHLCRPDQESGARAAERFFNASRPAIGDIVGTADMEKNPIGLTPAQLDAWRHEFCVTYQHLLSRIGIEPIAPILYSFRSFFSNDLGGDASNAKKDGQAQWIADLKNKAGEAPPEPPFTEVACHQHAFGERGGLDGLDRDRWMRGCRRRLTLKKTAA